MINCLIFWYKKGNQSSFFKYFVYPVFATAFVAGPVCFLVCCKDFPTVKPWLEGHPKTNIFLHVWPLISMYFIRIFKTIVEAYDKNEIVSAKQAMRL